LAKLPLDARDRASLLFSAHSIPLSMAQSSPYVDQLTNTASTVAEMVGWRSHRLVYQSRSGNPRDPWLVPDVLDALEEEAERGAEDVLVAPIGFICDHVEVLFDLDVEARERAEALGLRLHRVPTLGVHPAFVAALADVVERAVSD